MKSPICEFCLKSDILCSSCNKKLERGDIKQSELDVLRALYRLSHKFSSLKEVTIKRVISTSKMIVVITGVGHASKVVGKNGVVVKALASEFKKSLRVIDASSDSKEVISSLISPLNVKGINTLFKPDGIEKRVVLDVNVRKRLPITPNAFSKVLKEITGEDYSLVFN